MGAGKLTILEIPLNDLIGEHTDKEYPDPSVHNFIVTNIKFIFGQINRPNLYRQYKTTSVFLLSDVFLYIIDIFLFNPH